MTNLEKYIDEIEIEIAYGNCMDCSVCLIKNRKCKNCHSPKFKADIQIENLRWLLQEYQEPIKLKRFEYDFVYMLKEMYNEENEIGNLRVASNFASKGYLKGIKCGDTIRYILDHCEIVPNDYEFEEEE